MTCTGKKTEKRFTLLSEKGVAVNKKRKMKSPTGRFSSGNSLGCHFQHLSARERERESKAQSSMQPRLPPRLHTALCLTLSLSGTSMLKMATLKIARINDQ